MPLTKAKLHDDILNISFKHFSEIMSKFDCLGSLHIDHLSLDIADPDDQMVFFSTTPSTGYNVCSTDLWLADHTISPDFYKNKAFYFWDDAYSEEKAAEIKLVKEEANKLSQGFMLVRSINDFHLIYSFATKSKDANIREIITNNVENYLAMGDSAYQAIRGTYGSYTKHTPPEIDMRIKKSPFDLNLTKKMYDSTYLRNQLHVIG